MIGRRARCRPALLFLASVVVVSSIVSLRSPVAAEAASISLRTLREDAAPASGGSSSSNIIPSAGAAQLTNGLGDLRAAGACGSFVKTYCKDITEGEGRLAACLSKQLVEERQGNVVGRKLSPECIKELSDYNVDKVTNINKDVPLARACKDDVAKFCADKSDEKSPGSVVACLKDRTIVDAKSPGLSDACQAEVFRTQQEALEDIRLDVQLYGACQADLEKNCAGVEAGEGRQAACLSENQMQISWECKSQLLRYEKESQEDIRLSVRLLKKCQRDAKKFCKDVVPGHMRIQRCLEDKMEDPELSAGCKEELDNVLAKQVTNFRLNTRLRTHCEEDLQTMCGTTLATMDNDPTVKSQALACLQQYKHELKNPKCKKAVHRMMTRAGRDIRFDEALANACVDDRKKYCKDVQPGSARVIRCLEDNRSNLDQKCAAALFDHETRMAEDIDFKFPMKRACVFEIRIFCKNLDHGHARIVRCLQEHLEDDDMGPDCKAEVISDMHRMATDYRLNWRLNHACTEDIGKQCPNMCISGRPCGGLVLQCLQEKQDNITNPDCQQEVFYYQLMEVSDYKNDVILAEACRQDVETYCKNVEPGEGRVHTCLRTNRNVISERCRKEEMKLAATEYHDIRLRPKLNKLCSEEKAVFCKDVKPGRARVIKCLMENMAKPNFGQECKAELETREEAMKSDYRFDAGVSTSCASDIDLFCKDQATKLHGNATVLKCLVENFKTTTETCQVELSRAVRLALWSYKPGAGLTDVCDGDVVQLCPKNSMVRASAPLTIGVVGRCLSKALVQNQRLDPKCRGLVLVAAPKDARAYHDGSVPETSSGLVRKIAELQKAAGLDAVLVDPYTRNGSPVTVTGWVALACMLSLAVVFFGGLVLLYRKYSGLDKPQTLHVKMGDA